MTFNFEIEEPSEKIQGEVLGIDVGQTDAFYCSNGISSQKNKHGHDLNSICDVLSRKKKDSNAFKRAQDHRTNYINWSINQLDLKNYKQVNLENIKHLRRGRRSSRKLSHWTYTELFSKLESYCVDHGVHVEHKNPTYTSQRCSECGWTRKSNRIGKQFKCDACNFVCDADLNASKNIALELPGISKKQRLKRLNIKGFYWNTEGQERIVPVVQRENFKKI